MTHQEYLNQLGRYLKHIPPKDYQDTPDYFAEYFEERGPQHAEQVMADLGSPKEAAHDILTHLYEKERDNERPRNRNLLRLVGLSLLTAPLNLAATLALFSLFLLLLLLLFLILLAFSGLWASLILAGLASFWLAIEVATLAWFTSLFFLGLGMIAISLGLLATRGTIVLGSRLCQHLLHSIRQVIYKGEPYETV